MGFQLAELDAGLRFSPVEVYVLDDLDRVLPGAPLVLHISDDGACLALLERVLEPGAASPEDAQYIAMVLERHHPSDREHGALRTLIEDIITLASAHDGALDSAHHRHVNAAV